VAVKRHLRNVTLWSSPQQHIRDFFVKTDFDKVFRNANLLVNAKIKNYSSSTVKANILSVALYQGNIPVSRAVAIKGHPIPATRRRGAG
jgi:beta-galactosidase